MALIGTNKEALLKQIERTKNLVTIDQITQLLANYTDLKADDFKGKIPDALFEQLRHPEEAKAWSTINAASPVNEQELRDIIGSITDFIKKYPDSKRLSEAETMKKGYETDLVSMKLWAEIEKTNPLTQREIGREIRRVSEFIDKYPDFSQIEAARKRREDLENRIDNSLWRGEWERITAANNANRGSREECEALLGKVNDFIEEYPICPMLDNAIALKSELENKIAHLEGEDKALDTEWQALARTRPTTVADYRSLIARVSDFIGAHPGWSNIGEARALLKSLQARLDTMVSQEQEQLRKRQEEEKRRQEEEKRRQEEERRREERRWMDEWEAISRAPSASAADKEALVSRLARFIDTYPSSPKRPDAIALKKKYEQELAAPSGPSGDAPKGNGSMARNILIAVAVLIAIAAILWFTGVFSPGDGAPEPQDVEADTVTVVETEAPIEIDEDMDSLSKLPPDLPANDDTRANDDKATPGQPTPPPAPREPDWVRKFDAIDRKVNGGEIVRINYIPDRANPSKVEITVHYPDFSANTITPSERQKVLNLKKDIISRYRSQIPVDIKVVALDVNKKTIE